VVGPLRPRISRRERTLGTMTEDVAGETNENPVSLAPTAMVSCGWHKR